MRRVSVGDIMTRNFISAKPKSSLYDCAKRMAKERVNSLLVIDGKRLVGIITARDILWVITKKPGLDLRKIKVMKIATRKLAVIKPSADIFEALEKMKSSNFRRLPVLAGNEIIGVVTLKDILAIEPNLYGEMRHILDDIREEGRKQEQADVSYPLEGICDNCGALSNLLKVEGQLLCLDCREELY